MGTLKFKNIFSILVILAALAALCSANPEELNILGGKKAQNGQFPFIALVTSSIKLEGRNISRQCGGAIYNTKWIITSAQCTSFALNNPSTVQVYVGDVKTSSMQMMEVKSIIIDENFKAPSYQYDIALVELKTALKFSSNVAAIKVATDPPSKSTYYTAGWGVSNINNTARSKNLFYIPQVFSSPKNCQKMFPSPDKKKEFYPDTSFCTEGGDQNVCAGDSGAPVFSTKNIDKATDAVLYGLVSFGKGCQSAVNVNTRIDAFSCWIGNTIDGNSRNC